jgi:hypothetical protein
LIPRAVIHSIIQQFSKEEERGGKCERTKKKGRTEIRTERVKNANGGVGGKEKRKKRRIRNKNLHVSTVGVILETHAEQGFILG